MDPVSSDVLVDLVAREKEDVRVHDAYVLYKFTVWKGGVLVAGKACHHNFLLLLRVLSDYSVEILFLYGTVSFSVFESDAIGDVACVVPSFDPEGGGARERIYDRVTGFLPIPFSILRI